MSKVKPMCMRAVVRNTKNRTKSVKRTHGSAMNMEVRELDPQRKCGSGTTVERMYRVIERVDGLVTNHLVFLDRHGWYCEHGRSCTAVAAARARTA